MIAYDKVLLDNVYIDEETNRLKQSGFISPEQYQSISQQLPRLKSHNNFFFRIGLFILGSLLYASICGMISLAGIGIMDHSYLFFLYFFAAIGFGTKEYMSKEMNYFGFGLDDAFILGAILVLLIAIGNTFEKNYDPNYAIVLIFMAIISGISYLRYLNLSLALLGCFGITGSLAYLTFEYLTIGKSILPFVMLLFSGSCYFIAKKKLESRTVPYYDKGLQLTKVFCLILFYLSANYYVVRELNFSLSTEYYYDGTSPEIPFSLFFWAFTIAIPPLYLYFALRNKDRMMLWIGFLALCFSVFTYKAYHHVMPPEVGLTIGGLVLFAFTYFAIKKTKHNETGITFKEDRFSNPSTFANLQVVMAASQFGLKPEAKVEESPMKFGGGGFSGGGSGEEF